MIKIILASVLLSASSAAFASEGEYNVSVSTVKTTQSNLVVSFRTHDRHSSICQRTVMALQLGLPVFSYEIGIPRPAMGLVSFTTTTLPSTRCLRAFGPHNGSLQLPLGANLPAVADGYYKLVIDGFNYGIIEISGENASLVSEESLPQ